MEAEDAGGFASASGPQIAPQKHARAKSLGGRVLLQANQVARERSSRVESSRAESNHRVGAVREHSLDGRLYKII